MVSEEIVEEEEFHDVGEGQVEAIEEDDDDLAVVSGVSFELVGGGSTTARGDPEPMDVVEGDPNKAKSSGTSSGKAGKSSSASASAGATPPMLKSKSKAKPEKKAMPKLKVVDEGHGNDSVDKSSTHRFSRWLRTWFGPDNMIGVPNRIVDYDGRLSAISHSMSDYLRGHRLFHRRPSPEIRRSDLSMDFKALVRHLQGDFPHLREQEGSPHGGQELTNAAIQGAGQWDVIRHTSLDSCAHPSHPREQKFPRP